MGEQEKENAMICNGGVPPQMIHIMEMYQIYVNNMVNLYQFWLATSGAGYWYDQWSKSQEKQDK